MIGQPLYIIETPHLDLRLLGVDLIVDRLTVGILKLANCQRGVVVVFASTAGKRSKAAETAW